MFRSLILQGMAPAAAGLAAGLPIQVRRCTLCPLILPGAWWLLFTWRVGLSSHIDMPMHRHAHVACMGHLNLRAGAGNMLRLPFVMQMVAAPLWPTTTGEPGKTLQLLSADSWLLTYAAAMHEQGFAARRCWELVHMLCW